MAENISIDYKKTKSTKYENLYILIENVKESKQKLLMLPNAKGRQ